MSAAAAAPGENENKSAYSFSDGQSGIIPLHGHELFIFGIYYMRDCRMGCQKLSLHIDCATVKNMIQL